MSHVRPVFAARESPQAPTSSESHEIGSGVPFGFAVVFVAGLTPQFWANRFFQSITKFCPWRSDRFQRAVVPLPFFVMILRTPLDASVPYSVAALGPFNTSMDSMSCGLRSFKREIELDPNAWLIGPVATSLFTRTPSM